MTTDPARRVFAALLAAALLAPVPALRAATQAAHFSTEPVTFGTAGYLLNFDVAWSCDDAPQPTTSAPGEIDLIDAGGNLVAQVHATIGGGNPLIQVQGAGTISGAFATVTRLGAGGTPADAFLHAAWRISGPAAGSYTFRFWFFQEAVTGFPLSTITTQATNAGGGGPLGGNPPPPAAPPPAVALSVPASATVFQPAEMVATASEAAGGHALAAVGIDASLDGGVTWVPIGADSHPSSPSDVESDSYVFAQAGTALVRATVTDASGLQASAQKALVVAKASQAAIVITPASATVSAGQSVAFTVSGGATGNYAWGGTASGSGPAQTVAFPSPGNFTVTAVDTGNSNYNSSALAVASVSVQAALFTLSVSSTPGGTVAGGGSYPPDAQATASATAAAGNTFTGWTGDVSSPLPILSVLMDSNKAIMAHFAPLLAQTISYLPPGPLSTRSPAFALSVAASSGLPVTLALDSGPVTLAGDTLTPTGVAGEVTLTATQPGNSQYLPAPPVVITFAIGLPPPGVLLSDDSATTKKTDRQTRTTSFRSGPAH